MKILIIEDEKYLADALQNLLEQENYLTQICYDGKSGLDEALTGTYDLVLLDIMLPKTDGLEILTLIRQEKIMTKVMLLTARDHISDRVMGLDLGADDYLTKPFAFEELIARVKALLRRQGDVTSDVLEFGDLKLNYHALQLYKDKESIQLTSKENEILQVFMTRKDMISSKELLIEKLWGFDADVEDNNVEVYISFLRKKLKFLNSLTQIKTTRGVGYSLEA